MARFLHHEAELLDARRFEEWLDLFDPGGRLWVPSRSPTAGAGEPDPTRDVSIIYEEVPRLRLRVARLLSGKEYAQDPPSATIRQVTNVVVEAPRPTAPRSAGSGRPRRPFGVRAARALGHPAAAGAARPGPPSPGAHRRRPPHRREAPRPARARPLLREPGLPPVAGAGRLCNRCRGDVSCDVDLLARAQHAVDEVLPDGVQVEVLDGLLVVNPPPSLSHAELTVRLAALLTALAPGELRVNPAGIGVYEHDDAGAEYQIPDVVVYRPPANGLATA